MVAIVGAFAVVEAVLPAIALGHMEAAVVARTMGVCVGISAVARAHHHLPLLHHLQTPRHHLVPSGAHRPATSRRLMVLLNCMMEVGQSMAMVVLRPRPLTT